MSYTKAQARTFVRALLGDKSADSWQNASLDVLISTTLDELWGDLLDVASYATSQVDTLASITTPGYIDLRTQAAGGLLSQRFYRIQKVKRNGREYTEGDRASVLVIGNVEQVSTKATWVVFGNQLWLFPLDLVNSVELQYSYLPPSFLTLQDTDNISWPDGTENAFLFEAVARITKDETYAGIAGAAMAKAKANVTRLGVGPFVMQVYDSPESWGGNA